jgi:hypothetical protein
MYLAPKEIERSVFVNTPFSFEREELCEKILAAPQCLFCGGVKLACLECDGE